MIFKSGDLLSGNPCILVTIINPNCYFSPIQKEHKRLINCAEFPNQNLHGIFFSKKNTFSQSSQDANDQDLKQQLTPIKATEMTTNIPQVVIYCIICTRSYHFPIAASNQLHTVPNISPNQVYFEESISHSICITICQHFNILILCWSHSN